MTRVEWSANGDALLACASRQARVIAPNGDLIFALPDVVIEARWTPRGVVAIDEACTLTVYDGGRRSSGATSGSREAA